MSVPDHLTDPEAIYRLSFDTIRREADLSALSSAEAAIATRIMHACGMTDIVPDLVFGGDVSTAARAAMAARRVIFTDVEMVRAAVITRFLPADVSVRCTLNDPAVRDLAATGRTTRTAAAVSLWRADLDGAVVIIGNAPTALYALLKMLDDGAPRPAAVFAFPVGFVGAAESKEALIDGPRGLNFVTLRHRRGGSAIAAAAFNAVMGGADDR